MVLVARSAQGGTIGGRLFLKCGYFLNPPVEGETCSSSWISGSGKAGKLVGCDAERKELSAGAFFTFSKSLHELPHDPE